MGISNFPSSAEGIIPVLVMNTVVSVVRSVLQVMGAPPNLDQEYPSTSDDSNPGSSRISITRFGYLCNDRSKSSNSMECCVCHCGFKADEEVSELSCKHFFHRGCLEKWFCKSHTSTCPLCRSIL